jgi:hypothetical protein
VTTSLFSVSLGLASRLRTITLHQATQHSIDDIVRLVCFHTVNVLAFFNEESIVSTLVTDVPMI